MNLIIFLISTLILSFILYRYFMARNEVENVKVIWIAVLILIVLFLLRTL